MNLFDVVPANFFLPISCSNRRFYADCIIDLYEYLTVNGQFYIDKDIVYAVIDNCLSKYQGTLLYEPDEDAPVSQLQLEKPLTKEMVFRKLSNCGWLETEFDADGKTKLVSFPNYAEDQIKSMQKIMHPTKIYLGGYARSIIEALNDVFKVDKPYEGAFVSAIENTKTLMQEVRHIRSSLQKDISEILSCKDYQEAARLLDQYFDKALAGDLHKLQIEEGITSQMRNTIRDCLDRIQMDDELYARLVSGALHYYESIKSEEYAETHICEAINTIKSQLCDGYEVTLRSIINAQAKYLTNANTKIALLCMDNQTADSDINWLARTVSEMTDETFEEWESFFAFGIPDKHMLQLPVATFLDSESLYKARIRANEGKATTAPMSEQASLEFNLDDMSACISQFGVKACNKRVSQLLSGRSKVRGEEIPIQTKEQFYQLVGILILCNAPGREYNVIFNQEATIRRGDFSLPDFEIHARTDKIKGV